MKKLIVSLVLLMGLSFNVSATTPAAFISAGTMPVAFFSLMYAASEQKYEACNDLPYVKVKSSSGNYYFDSSQCDVDANKK